MAGILVVAEARRGALRDISLEAIGAGMVAKARSGGPLTVLVVDPDPARFAEELAVEGVDEVLLATCPTDFDPHLSQRFLEAAIAAVDPALVLAGHTVNSMAFAASAAATLGTGFASDVFGLDWDDGPIATRGAYGGKLEAVLEFPDKRQTILTLRAGAFEPAARGAGGGGARELAALEPDGPATVHRGYQETGGEGVDITAAEVLVSAGRGIGDQENLEKIEALADRLGATMSSSRPLVDAGWVPAERQVGQSGKTVKPRVYLALGISGAVQHLAGIQGAETVIAVNTDPQAPIFNVARYGVNADLFDVTAAIEARLDQR